MTDDILKVARGLVRPLVTTVLVGAVVVGFFTDKLPADALLSASTLTLGFWFGSRTRKEGQ